MSIVSACPNECRCDQRNRVYCNDRGLTEIPLDIPSNTEVLYLQDNFLTSSNRLEMELNRFTKLERLMMYNNRLTRIPALNSRYLRELRLNNNRISYFGTDSLEKVPNLSELILDENRLSENSIYPGVFKNAEKISRISLNRNDFTEFPSKLPNSVQEVFLTGNKISRISIQAIGPLSSLNTLFIDRNELNDSSIEKNSFSGLLSLKQLELSNNAITKMPPNLSNKLEKLYLSGNKLEFLSKLDLEGLSSLKTLDIALNQLKLIEKGTFEQLETLGSIDLSGNNWVCDCHMKSLKSYLKKNPVHYGSRGDVICGDFQYSGNSLDSVREENLTCSKVDFNLTQSEFAVFVHSSSSNQILPPFVQFRLRVEEATSGVLHYDVPTKFPIHHKLETLMPDTEYKICLYNSYIMSGANVPDESCTNFKTEMASGSVGREVIIGISFGCFGILAVLAVFIYAKYAPHSIRNGFWSKMLVKLRPSTEDHDEKPSRLSRLYSSNLDIYTKRDLTTDASKEFNVTLMIRAPEKVTSKGPPPPYESIPKCKKKRTQSFTCSLESDDTNKTSLKSLSSRNELNLYI